MSSPKLPTNVEWEKPKSKPLPPNVEWADEGASSPVFAESTPEAAPIGEAWRLRKTGTEPPASLRDSLAVLARAGVGKGAGPLKEVRQGVEWLAKEAPEAAGREVQQGFDYLFPGASKRFTDAYTNLTTRTTGVTPERAMSLLAEAKHEKAMEAGPILPEPAPEPGTPTPRSRLLTGEWLLPGSLASMAVGVPAFAAQLGTSTGASALKATGLPTAEPTLKQIGVEAGSPYYELIANGNPVPLMEKALTTPEGVLMDLSIMGGVLKGGLNAAKGTQIRARVGKAWEKMRAEAKAKGSPVTRADVEALLIEHGVPAESIKDAADFIAALPDLTHRLQTEGIGEMLKQFKPEPRPAPAPSPVLPTAEGPLTQLAGAAVRSSPPSITELAARATRIQPTGPRKTAEQVRAAPQPTRRQPEVIGAAPIHDLVEEAYRPKVPPELVPPIVRKKGQPKPSPAAITAKGQEIPLPPDVETVRTAQGETIALPKEKPAPLPKPKGKKKEKGEVSDTAAFSLASAGIGALAGGVSRDEEGRLKFSPGGAVAGAVGGALVPHLARKAIGAGKQTGERGTLPLGRPGPVFISRLRSTVADKMPNSMPPEQAAAWVDAMVRKGEVKAEEVEYSRVREWAKGQEGKVSKDEMLAYLDEAGLKVNEKWLRGEHRSNAWYERETRRLEEAGDYEGARAIAEESNRPPGAKFSQYQEPGGKNYRELLIQLPLGPDTQSLITKRKEIFDWYDKRINKIQTLLSSGRITDLAKRARMENTLKLLKGERPEVWDTEKSLLPRNPTYASHHFDEPNVLVHARINDRVDASGRPGLFAEEIQSDWHQAGRKGGYSNAKARDEIEVAVRKYPVPEDMGYWSVGTLEKAGVPSELADQWFKQFMQGSGIPDAPFKKTWPLLAVKRLIREAVDNGKEWVGWTTGEMQAKRYDLSKHVRELAYNRTIDGDFNISGILSDGSEHDFGTYKPDALPGVVGKELSQKILNGEGKPDLVNAVDWRVFSGVDLKVGGEGMKSFYDQILPSEVNKYIKKWGGRVEATKIDIGSGFTPEIFDSVHSFSITPAMRDAVRKGQDLAFVRPSLAAPLAGAGIGAVAGGVEKDKEGKLRFSPTGALKGATLGAIGGAILPRGIRSAVRTGEKMGERGSLLFGKKPRTLAERNYEAFFKAASNLKRATAAEVEGTARRSAESVSHMRPENQEIIARIAEEEARDSAARTKPTAESRKDRIRRRNQALENEYLTPEPHSPDSTAAIAYLKSGNIKDYFDNMATLGELKAREVRGQEGVAEVRESGHAVHTSFAAQFVKVGDDGKVTRIAKDAPANRGWAEMLTPSRLMEWMDRKLFGELNRKLIRPSQDNSRSLLRYEYDGAMRLADIEERNGIRSEKEKVRVGRVLNGIKGETSPRILKAAEEMREFFNRALDEMNTARALRHQPLIPKRADYLPWVAEQTWRQRLFSERAKPEHIMEHAPAPDFIQPDKPFNPRELPRTADYDLYKKIEDPFQLGKDYLRTAGKDIFNTNTIHNIKVHAKWLKDMGYPNMSSMLGDWASEVFAGRSHWVDRGLQRLPRPARLAFAIQRRLKNWKMRAIFPGNLTFSFITQPTASATLLARVGLTPSIQALGAFLSPNLRRMVNATYTHVIKSAASPEVAAFRETIARFRKLDKPPSLDRVADRMSYFLKLFEKHLTNHAMAAGYFYGKNTLKLKGRDLLEFMSDTGARVQGMFNREDLPGLLRSNDIKATVPLQTFSFEAANNFLEISLGKGQFTGKAKLARAARLLEWYAGIFACNAISNSLLGYDVWSLPWSFIPFGGPIASLAGYTTRGTRYGSGWMTITQTYDDVKKAGRDVYYYNDWTSTRKLVLENLPAGIPMEKAARAMEMELQGGVVKDARGNVLFSVPKEQRPLAYLTGVWATPAAQEWRKRKEKEKTWIETILGGTNPKNQPIKRQSGRSRPSRGGE